MRKVKKADRPIGLGYRPQPTSDTAPVSPDPPEHHLDKKLEQPWSASSYPSAWSEEDIEFWRTQ